MNITYSEYTEPIDDVIPNADLHVKRWKVEWQEGEKRGEFIVTMDEDVTADELREYFERRAKTLARLQP